MTTPSDPFESEEPGTPPRPAPGRRRGNPLSSPRVTVGLAILVVILLAVAVVPGLNLPLPHITIDWGATPTPAATASPSPAASASADASPTFTRPTPTPLPTFISYLVKPGDSLNSIAALYSTKARSIAWWNRGTYPSLDPESPTYNPGKIEVGWTLVLMPGTVVDEEHPPSPSPGRNTPTPAASISPAASGSQAPQTSPSPAASR